MSKPDSAGDSLESILASIRKSLAEQSTDALSETTAAPGPGPEARPRRHGLTQRLAGAAPDARQAAAGGIADDLSDLLESNPTAMPLEPGIAQAGRAAPGPADGAAAQNDPLWFLSRREEPEASPIPAPVAPAGKAERPAAGEPALTRPEVFRASLPPFFGSSPSPAPVVLPPEPPARPAPAAGQVSHAALAAKAVADPALAHEVSLVAAAAEQAARPPAPASAPVANGRADASGGHAPGGGAALDSAYNRALEAMVLDLLKPMLKEWLDENMPRLVAEALDEEVRRVKQAKGDAGKT